MTKLPEYLHTAEAAEYLGAHHNTIRLWASRGKTPEPTTKSSPPGPALKPQLLKNQP
jgi:hypothetical protein